MSEPRRKFTIGPCLGRGGFGEVYRASMRSAGGLDTDVAVKVLKTDVDPRNAALPRLRDEGRMLARLNHPTILRVHDLVVLDGRVALVTEFIDGADLCDCALEPDPISLRATIQVIGIVAEALDAAWNAAGAGGQRLELIHRDIKPTNIRIGRHAEVKLLDFGIARSDRMDREADTHSKLVMGSLHYMAPERFVDGVAVPASDVFGLGCCLYETMTRERFFGTGGLREVSLLTVAEQRYQPWLVTRLDLLPRATPEIREFLGRLLAYDPEARPTAAEVAARAEEIGDRIGGAALKTWCRERAWPKPGTFEGPLEGRVLTEGTLSLGGAAERPDSSSVHGAPSDTVEERSGTSRGPPRRGAVIIPAAMPPLAGPLSAHDRGYTDDEISRPVPSEPPPSRPPGPAPVRRSFARIVAVVVGLVATVAVVLFLAVFVLGGATAAVVFGGYHGNVAETPRRPMSPPVRRGSRGLYEDVTWFFLEPRVCTWNGTLDPGVLIGAGGVHQRSASSCDDIGMPPAA